MKLNFKVQAKQMRFWGKILGSERDYYIAEGVFDSEEQTELPPNVEPRGQAGVNKMDYWVTNNLLSDWSELPVVTPEQIVLARKIKHIFTGDLEREVVVNPFFYGKEKELLKCQIVRIQFSTAVVPKNFYHLTDDDPKEIELVTEEFKPPEFEEVTLIKNWFHQTQSILKEGRLVHMRPEFGADDDEEKEMKKIEEQDPFEEKLKCIEEDKGIYSDQAWKIRVYGDRRTYKQNVKFAQPVNNGYVVVESLVWPGCYTKQAWSQIYIGYGFKATEQLFYPCYTEPIETEMPEYIDEHEPHVEPKEEKEEEEEEKKDDEDEEDKENEEKEDDEEDKEKEEQDEEENKENEDDQQQQEDEQQQDQDGDQIGIDQNAGDSDNN